MPPAAASRARPRAPTPADLVVIAVLLASVPLARVWRSERAGSTRLEIRSAAGLEAVDARIDRDLEVTGPAGVTVVRIHAGQAWIARAPCRNHVCQRMGRISGSGRSLVCIPNRVVVRFAAHDPGVDGVTR